MLVLEVRGEVGGDVVGCPGGGAVELRAVVEQVGRVGEEQRGLRQEAAAYEVRGDAADPAPGRDVGAGHVPSVRRAGPAHHSPIRPSLPNRPWSPRGRVARFRGRIGYLLGCGASGTLQSLTLGLSPT